MVGLGIAMLASASWVTGSESFADELSGASIGPEPFCTFFPNGKFDFVLADSLGNVALPAQWKSVADGGGYGDFEFDSEVRVVNAGGSFGNVVQLTAFSSASFINTWPSGSTGSGRAFIQSQAVELTGKTITFNLVGGGFGTIYFDGGKVGYNLAVRVRNLTTGDDFLETIAGDFFGSGPPLGCGNGLAIDGMFSPQLVCIDLSQQGFQQGDKIDVKFILQTNCAALGECDILSEIFAQVRLDNVRQCAACLTDSTKIDDENKVEAQITEEWLSE